MGFLFGRSRRRLRRQAASSDSSIRRFVGPGISVAGIVFMGFLLFTGRIDLSSLDAMRDTHAATDASASTSQRTAGTLAKIPPNNSRPVTLQPPGQKSNQTIRIATFRIQDFGVEKSADQNVMGVLARIVSQFDVVAIQGVSGDDATPVRRMIELLRNAGARYAATVSEPIGRATQTESYAFFWDESRMRIIPQSAYVVQDTADRLQREPMVASFETRVGSEDGRNPFRFTLVNAHSPPTDRATAAISSEMNVLDDVFIRVRQYDFQMTGEDDCIMLGNLNVDPAGLGELKQIPGMESLAGDIKTDARRTKTFDHILIDTSTTREYTGRFGVIDFQRDIGLTEEQANMVSDHHPLWAEFSAFELPRPAPMATGPQVIR